MLDSTISTIAALLVRDTVLDIIQKVLPEHTVRQLLFSGQELKEYKTEDAYKALNERYKDSIDEVNRIFGFNLIFAGLALYAYFILPISGSIEVPNIKLSVSRHTWISLTPLISFGLQTFMLTSFVWFMLLRRGLKILKEAPISITEEAPAPADDNDHTSLTSASSENLVDLTNINLKGSLGQLWMVFRIGGYFESRLNYIWYTPVFFSVLIVFLSPLLVCVFFVHQLFRAGNFWLGLVYSLLLVCYSILLILLIGTVAILGLGEKNSPKSALS